MEVKFNKNTCPCLRKAVCQVQNQEQTQEVRLSESMPDIGRVLGSWGQVLIRGKEWRTGGMSVSGGVMAWVLYAPEDGSEPRSVQTWIPFQMKWDLPETERDGTICVTPLLKGIDARSTSARKLMVRANVSLLGEALEPIEPEVCCPGQIPEDVQLLSKSYPVELPQEAGEKLFQLDEELTLPGNLPAVDKILRYSLIPEVIEQKVMAGRLVFRGKGSLHLVYSGPEGAIHSWDTEIPFSQYTELDRDHSANAASWIAVVLTGLEMDRLEERKLSLKAAMAAQYVIFDRVMLDVVEDAYSPVRSVGVQVQELNLPVRLDVQRERIHVDQSVQAQGERAVDVCWLPEHPVQRQNGDMAELVVPGQFQTLYLDENGNLQSSFVRGEAVWQIHSDARNSIDAYLHHEGDPEAAFTGETVALTVDVAIEAAVFAEAGIPMVTGLELGDVKEPDPMRPSLILRRAGGGSLWDIAKECGSTVDAIKTVNRIQEEPESGRMLLIPVS